MRARPNAGWRNRGFGGLAVALSLTFPLSQAAAQQADRLPSGALGAEATDTPDAGASADALRGSTVIGSGAPVSSETSGGTRLATRPRSNRSGSALASGATSGSNNRGPTSFLRNRAIPTRRQGSSTTLQTQATTQNTPYDLRLTPVIRNPVVGVPLSLPSPLPLAGLQTPGILLGTALRRPIATDEAYAPLGIKLGTFTFLPALQQSIGYDTNPDQITARFAKPSVALRTEAELAFRSDWSSSELSGELRGGYLDFPDNEGASRPNGAGVTRLRIDANRDTRFDVEGRFLLETQRAGTPDLSAAVTSRPLVSSYGTTFGVTEKFNRVQVSVRGLVDRSEFENAQLTTGTILRQSDRNLTQYGLELRAGYELSSEITPFVDLLSDSRVYDLRTDSVGVRRDSDGLTLSGGAAFALTRFVSGEISAGVQHRTYVDPTLRDLTAPVMNAALIWSVSPLTTVRINAAAGIVETAVANSSGVLTQNASIEVQHDLLRNLSLIGGFAYLSSDYGRANITERGFSATARLDYRFNRWLAVRGSYIFQRVDSSVAGFSFQSNTFLLGLRVNP